MLLALGVGTGRVSVRGVCGCASLPVFPAERPLISPPGAKSHLSTRTAPTDGAAAPVLSSLAVGKTQVGWVDGQRRDVCAKELHSRCPDRHISSENTPKIRACLPTTRSARNDSTSPSAPEKKRKLEHPPRFTPRDTGRDGARGIPYVTHQHTNTHSARGGWSQAGRPTRGWRRRKRRKR
jgi:hypothetical protein